MFAVRENWKQTSIKSLLVGLSPRFIGQTVSRGPGPGTPSRDRVVGPKPYPSEWPTNVAT